MLKGRQTDRRTTDNYNSSFGHWPDQWSLVSGCVLESNAASADSLVSLTYIFCMTDSG